jgi:anti-anti-sigma factor
MYGTGDGANAGRRPLFEAELDITAEVARVALSGELDIAAAERLHATFERAIASDAPEVRVDLADLRFIDAAGIGELIRAHAELGRANRRMIIARVPTTLRRTMRLAEADWLLE